jgi:hypothetical protein
MARRFRISSIVLALVVSIHPLAIAGCRGHGVELSLSPTFADLGTVRNIEPR